MKPHKTLTWLSALLLLAGCPGPGPETTRPIATVTVTCTPASLQQGETSQCEAIAKDEEGVKFDQASFAWRSSDVSVATVDQTGTVTARLKAGTAIIYALASAERLSKLGQASVTVAEKAPTVHTGNITASETWRTADNPHEVSGVIEVNAASAPTLTIEPGVVLSFQKDAALRVLNGALKAMGTAQAPIRMEAKGSTPTDNLWQGLVFATKGSGSELNHVTLSHCGGALGRGGLHRGEDRGRAPAASRDGAEQRHRRSGRC